MRNLCLLLLLASVLVLGGCGEPVPPEKEDYVGLWQSPAMSLLITQDGSVDYERLKGGASTSVQGPLKGFEGDDFTVGIGPFKTTFEVSKPPHEEEGVWKMVVDGIELTRVK